MKAAPKTRNLKTQLLGAYVPVSIFEGILQWVSMNEERSTSAFIREAAREKLRRDGIKIKRDQESLPLNDPRKTRHH